MKRNVNESKTNKTVNYVPKGYHTVTPYLVVDNADKLIGFIEEAFDGQTNFMTRTDDQKVMHASVGIGNSLIMVSDTMDKMPEEHAMLFLYVEDVDKVFSNAVKAGGTEVREVLDEFYGDRAGAIKDPCGNTWWIATHKKDIDDKELKELAGKAKDQTKEYEPA